MRDEISGQADSQPAKRKRGRQPGSPNPKTRYRPPAGQTAAQQRQWLRDNSAPIIENLLRKALGKRHKAEGPTGKQIWRETTPEQQERAEIQVINRVLPTLSSVALYGERDGDPIRVEAGPGTGLPDRDKELARRLALVFNIPINAVEQPEDNPSGARRINGSSGYHALPEPAKKASECIEIGDTIDLPEGAVAKCTSADSADRGTWRVERSDGSLVHILPGNSEKEVRQWTQLAHEGGRFRVA